MKKISHKNKKTIIITFISGFVFFLLLSTLLMHFFPWLEMKPQSWSKIFHGITGFIIGSLAFAIYLVLIVLDNKEERDKKKNN